MMKPQITLYIDIISPFTYIAFHVLQTSSVFSEIEITYKPCFLPGIMKACGTKPPLDIKNKGPYMFLDRLRWARLFSVPMNESLPPGFPKSSLPVQRALCAIAIAKPERLEDCMAALCKGSWVEHLDIYEETALRSILVKLFGEDEASGVLEKSKGADAKSLLQSNTDEALSQGSFGLPWFVATNTEGKTEYFWGFDHLGQVCEYLGIETPQRATEAQRVERGWKAML